MALLTKRVPLLAGLVARRRAMVQVRTLHFQPVALNATPSPGSVALPEARARARAPARWSSPLLPEPPPELAPVRFRALGPSGALGLELRGCDFCRGVSGFRQQGCNEGSAAASTDAGIRRENPGAGREVVLGRSLGHRRAQEPREDRLMVQASGWRVVLGPLLSTRLVLPMRIHFS